MNDQQITEYIEKYVLYNIANLPVVYAYQFKLQNKGEIFQFPPTAGKILHRLDIPVNMRHVSSWCFVPFIENTTKLDFCNGYFMDGYLYNECYEDAVSNYNKCILECIHEWKYNIQIAGDFFIEK